MGRLRKNNSALKILELNPKFIPEPSKNKGIWNNLFENKNKIYLEIGAGKGRFIVETALNNPNINFIAIDKYETILIKLQKKILEKNVKNIYFFQADAKNLMEIFCDNEISKIYLNFSDPWPKYKHQKRRLTHLFFLNIYKNILSSNGDVEFRTDNNNLYKFTKETLIDNKINIKYNTSDLHNDEELFSNVMTEYERKFSLMGIKIKKICFNF